MRLTSSAGASRRRLAATIPSCDSLSIRSQYILKPKKSNLVGNEFKSLKESKSLTKRRRSERHRSMRDKTGNTTKVCRTNGTSFAVDQVQPTKATHYQRARKPLLVG